MLPLDHFQEIILTFYRNEKRHLPWRPPILSLSKKGFLDPYKILVSEVMLQQTQVGRVIQKYKEFLERFPTIQTLAHAPLREAVTAWSGLGYNRRAMYLHQAAKTIASQYKGIVPRDPSALEKLPGIGKATAASIVVFAYNLPCIFIETNVRRVFIHFFFQGKDTVGDKEIIPLVEESLDKKNPREWYYALMDYGTFLGKKGENPNRKSKHYTRQSNFEGSVRKVRGEIIRLLIREKKISLQSEYLKTPKAQKALVGLQKDGLITIQNKSIVLAGE